jgi:uncharacterized protein
MPTWNEKKRLANIAKHGVDFAGCEVMFDGPIVTLEDVRDFYGERRQNGVGWLNGRLMHITYTERAEDFHVISLRKAEKREIEGYEKAFAPNKN